MDDGKINIIFARRIRELRDERGLNQEDIGAWFNMRKSTVSQWEGGRLPHATIIAELAKKFSVTTDYLLGRTDYRTPEHTIALHRDDDPMDDLPPEAIRSIEEFKELMRLKYKKNPAK
jgi:Predicted transcriptional regulators